MNRLMIFAVSMSVFAGTAACDTPAEGEGEGEGEVPPYIEILVSIDELARLGDDNGTVKYIAAVADIEPRAPVGDRCLFQNMEQHPFHLPFLQSLEGGADLAFSDYITLVLKRSTRVWWGGEVRFLPQRAHPITGVTGTLIFALYTEDSPGNRLAVDDVIAVHAVLSACAPSLASKLAFVPTSTEQTTTTRAAQAALAEAGVGVLLEGTWGL